MKFSKILLLIAMAFIQTGCFICMDRDDPELDSTIFFTNNSDKSLLEDFVVDLYPDTIIPTKQSPFSHNANLLFVIKPHYTRRKEGDWKSNLLKSQTGVMTFFLFDKAIIDTVPWEKVREDYLVAKRYEYTLKQLDSLNWTITYP